MKKTVKTSRVAGQLEKMYRLLNARFFNGELPEVVISLKKTVGAYGHFTCSKVWQAGDERRYEINISSATLSRAIEDTCSTLLHEMCHCFAAEKGIKDTSGSGNFYHNRKYKEIAESHGLCVEKHPKYGWTITSPGLPLLDFIEEQGWQDLQPVGCNRNAAQRNGQWNRNQDQEAQQHPQICLPLLPPERKSHQNREHPLR